MKHDQDRSEILGLLAEIGTAIRSIEPSPELVERVLAGPCGPVREAIASSLDEPLLPETLTLVATHLRTCEDCREVATILGALAELGRAGHADASLSSTIAAMPSRRAQRPRHARFFSRPRVISQRAAAVAAMLLSVLTTNLIPDRVWAAQTHASSALTRVEDGLGSAIDAIEDTGRGQVRALADRAWSWTEERRVRLESLQLSDAPSTDDTSTLDEEGSSK